MAVKQSNVFKWLSKVASNRNGLEIIPKGTLQMLLSVLKICLFLSQKNLVTSLELSLRLTCKNDFSLSETTAILFKRKRNRIPVRYCSSVGPFISIHLDF